jgi:hypothetical protein
MSIDINIAGTIISMPTTGQDPSWAEAIVQFAQVVADNVNATVSAGDILPNFFTIDSLNPGTNVNIPGFAFDTTIVRSAEIKYAVIRQRDATTITEEGSLFCVYNPDAAPGQLFEVSREFTGDAKVTFTILDSGQVQISTEAISGTGAHSGTLSYQAKALLQA